MYSHCQVLPCAKDVHLGIGSKNACPAQVKRCAAPFSFSHENEGLISEHHASKNTDWVLQYLSQKLPGSISKRGENTGSPKTDPCRVGGSNILNKKALQKSGTSADVSFTARLADILWIKPILEVAEHLKVHIIHIQMCIYIYIINMHIL